MRFLYLMVFLTGFITSQAQSRPYIPALFDVQKLASDDVLNVRKTPDAGSDVVGTLAYDAKSVEVVALSEDGKWGLVNSDGYSTGWVLLRLMVQTVSDPVSTDFERDLWCFGDEPFWTMDVRSAGTGELSLMGEVEPLSRSYVARARNRGFAKQLITATGESGDVTGFLQPTQCWNNDGVFGYSIAILHRRNEENLFVEGCCSLSKRGH